MARIQRVKGANMFKAKEYVKAHTLEEAWELNQKRGNLIVAGMMWLKLTRNKKLTAVDLSGLGLDQISETEDGFEIGCMCSLRQLETHQGLNQAFSGIFRECTRHIVGVQFRRGATIGGSVYGRYGFSDVLTALLALDTYVELHKGGLAPLEEYISMPYDRDIVVKVIIKKDGRKAAYASVRRSETDFPVLALCAGRDQKYWYLSVGARPARADLLKLSADMEAGQAAEYAAKHFSFGDNMRASSVYRRHLAGIYLHRLMKQLMDECLAPDRKGED